MIMEWLRNALLGRRCRVCKEWYPWSTWMGWREQRGMCCFCYGWHVGQQPV